MLKSGFTTGSCAAAAAKASAVMALSRKIIETVSIMTPSGTLFETEVINAEVGDNCASCAVKKYSGDDPDVTNGILIYAEVSINKSGKISIDGGKGVGRVTKKGLGIEIGQAAINRVPRIMIENEVREAIDSFECELGADIIISAENGEEIAKKTFNPRLGIEGGISILGTSGIVEPMSRKALIDSIKAEIRVKKANEGDILLMTPGNYGAEFIKNQYGLDIDKALKCSNFIGESITAAVECGFKEILLVGHVGKLVKLAGGIGDTHSRNADCRMEILASNAAFFTDDIKVIRNILECTTTEEAASVLRDNGILDDTMKRIADKAKAYIDRLTDGRAECGIVMFTNELGILSQSGNVKKLLKEIKEN